MRRPILLLIATFLAEVGALGIGGAVLRLALSQSRAPVVILRRRVRLFKSVLQRGRKGDLKCE
jgi:hypothetical protein